MVLNRITECAAPNKRKPDLLHVRYLVIHRISLAKKIDANPDPIKDDDLDAAALARVFRNKEMGTGGWVPYHLILNANGRCEQTMPLSCVGAHAKGYNSQSIAIAAIGDFRKHEPPITQMRPLSRECARLVMINRGLTIGGHTRDFPGSSADEDKVCPGPFLSIPKLVQKVTERLPPDWRYRTDDEVASLLRLGGYTL